LVEWNGFLSGLELCSHCKRDYRVLLSSDIGVKIHSVGDMLYFLVYLLLFEGDVVLYCESYVIIHS